MIRIRHVLASLLLAVIALPASAVTVYYATLDQNEPTPTGSPGTGTARIWIDGTMMHFQSSWSGLIGDTTVAHLHCCTALPDTGAAGVATPVPTFPGFPAGVTAGSYEASFDMSLASSWNPTFITNNGGTPLAAFATLVSAFDTGRSYFNIHTTQFPGGEIRGFIHAIPEPETYALMLLGLGAVMVAARRRKG